jgi:hypothetical protein
MNAEIAVESFMGSAHMLFPGAKITTAGEYTQGATWGHKVIEILNKPETGEGNNHKAAR